MFAVFVLGVILAMLGLSLVVKGDTRVGKRRIHKAAARRFGVFLLCFFPFVLVERAILRQFDPDEEIDPFLIHGIVAGVWLIVGLIWFLRIARRPERKRPQPSDGGGPTGPPFPDPIGMPPIPASARRRQPDNPFDFK